MLLSSCSIWAIGDHSPHSSLVSAPTAPPSILNSLFGRAQIQSIYLHHSKSSIKRSWLNVRTFQFLDDLRDDPWNMAKVVFLFKRHTSIDESFDQCQYLSNFAPSPPLIQKLTLACYQWRHGCAVAQILTLIQSFYFHFTAKISSLANSASGP